ncbi:hypothetical protein [Paramaledivibacter caminithermalis]|uniref:Antitoxin Phd_YefM, type II toxin-antitoxin system n=1 Tax=Paramaledivibacter caminithermalis (strain DSM 15212 / CIP 107654 / DViRD3) TaxID=1121301 RepID=A0A1M6MT25_PARC5|nr:hypothetical protein [Paramaledivibacter caminithermalis]SHJ86604.1 hypothetical protein SAMN02745912_01407 [Paramaledivibacter caminithermalis DSM 15212]
MRGLTTVDFGVANDSIIELSSLDLDTIKSLLLLTNLEHKKFLITENDKPIATIVPADEYQKTVPISKKKLSEQELISILAEYEKELDSII